MKYIIVMAIMFGCHKNEGKAAKLVFRPVDIVCIKLKSNLDGDRSAHSQNLMKCENNEVVCYTNQQFRGSGIWCYKKEIK